MIIRQLYTNCLAQASYFIASEGEAAVIDPLRDIDTYLELAASNKATIRYIFVTHFHADFVSGQQELAKRTGAAIIFGEPANPEYPAVIAADNQQFALGSCSIRVLHTPGHTVESACFLLLDENGKSHALFTGDTLFIGDAGRPDLLSGNLDARTLAGMLFDSIRTKIGPLPDEVIVYPGHGAGSACGKKLSKETFSSLGEQKQTNPVFSLDKSAFIDAITSGQPTVPVYFFKDAAINRNGCRDLSEVLRDSLNPLDAEAFAKEMAVGTTVLDTRSVTGTDLQIIKGAVHIGLDGQFAIWAGTVLDFDTPLLLATDPGTETEVITRLSRIGFDRCKGFLTGGMAAWERTGRPVSLVPCIRPEDLKRSDLSRGTFQVLDVRRAAELEQEHLAIVTHIPLEELAKRLPEIDPSQAWLVLCAGGYRSLIAVSLLKKAGFEKVSSLSGGMAAIKAAFPELVITSSVVV